MTNYRITNLTTNESYEQEIVPPLRPATLLPVPYFAQLGPGADANHNDCGAAAGLMVLKAHDQVLQMNVDQFYKEANPTGVNDPLWVGQIRKVLSTHTVATDYKVAFDEPMLFNCLRQRKPVIALFNYGTLVDKGLTQFLNFRGAHFAVIIGMDSSFIYLNDPYSTEAKGQARPIPIDVFWLAWKNAVNDGNPDRAGFYPTLGIGEVPVVIPGALYRIRITCNAQRIRSGPGENFDPPIDLVYKNTILSVYEETNGWGRVAAGRWIFLGAPFNTRVA
jgi:Papain-like cysteine protease AvrRpt2